MEYVTKYHVVKRIVILCTILSSLFLSYSAYAFNSWGFNYFIYQVKKEAIARGISQDTVRAAFQGVQQLPFVIQQDRKQAGPRRPSVALPSPSSSYLNHYLHQSITDKRVLEGRQFYSEHQFLLKQISAKYGVQPQYILALWGLETNYGSYTGNFPLFSALATLAYDKRRGAMFRKELFAALEIVDKGYARIDDMRGSWAGAMGQCQFMPSGYLNYAIDYGNKGYADIWRNHADVFASIANYLHKFHWDSSSKMVYRAKIPGSFNHAYIGEHVQKSLSQWRKLGIKIENVSSKTRLTSTAYSLIAPEGSRGPAYLINAHNFKVIMIWNHSHAYALSVGLLANAMKEV